MTQVTSHALQKVGKSAAEKMCLQTTAENLPVWWSHEVTMTWKFIPHTSSSDRKTRSLDGQQFIQQTISDVVDAELLWPQVYNAKLTYDSFFHETKRNLTMYCIHSSFSVDGRQSQAMPCLSFSSNTVFTITIAIQCNPVN